MIKHCLLVHACPQSTFQWQSDVGESVLYEKGTIHFKCLKKKRNAILLEGRQDHLDFAYQSLFMQKLLTRLIICNTL